MTKIEDLDPSLSALAAALEKLPGVVIVSAGKIDPDSWWIAFQLDRDPAGRLSEDGWLSLEFITWLVNHDASNDPVALIMDSLPPYLNNPGSTLEFLLKGWDGFDPDELARWIAQIRDEVGFFRGESGDPFYDFGLN